MAMLINSLWAALFAAGLAILLTAPRYIAATFLCAFAGRLVRDLLFTWGLNQNRSTLVAAFVVVLVAGVIIRRHPVSPVVLCCSIIPLGAATALFNMFFDLMTLSSADGEALNFASVALVSNMAKVLAISLDLALGVGAGLALVRLLRRGDTAEV